MYRYRAAVIALLLFGTMAVGPSLAAPNAQACELTLGFTLMRGIIPHIVGDCAEAPRLDPATANIEQRTSRGTFLRRYNEKWPYYFVQFTDGTTTWLYGPNGLESRANTAAPFPWEAGTVPVMPPVPIDMLNRAGYEGPYDPYFPDRNCGDFRNQNEAQAFFVTAGGYSTLNRAGSDFRRDRHGLDPDGDGAACFTLAPTPTPILPGDPIASPTPLESMECEHVALQEEAQDLIIAAGGPFDDPLELDADNDGEACESLPSLEDPLDNASDNS
jgi:hypothetical protein